MPVDLHDSNEPLWVKTLIKPLRYGAMNWHNNKTTLTTISNL